ncbi:unnamed protein product [Candidula unifasciata]|uniref:Nucleoporin p58/p45 n=1 Tax=Candidula unifasciata TaxID=100452 RepID=A0A8S4A3M7_9EUPU|nr:unnamed protein product [Candidula unifasciata]
MPGFISGNPGTTVGTASPFSFGLPKTTTMFGQGSTTGATATSGFSFGLPKTTATGLLATPATTSTPAFAGFGVNPTSSAPATGFSLGAPLAAASTASTGFGGFSFGKTTTATSAAPSFVNYSELICHPFVGLLGSTPASTSSSGLSLGLGSGMFGAPSGTTTSAASIFTSQPQTTAASIFTSLPQTTATVGLGGLDPNTALKSGKKASFRFLIFPFSVHSDGKTVKESLLPEPLGATVDALQKYVKEEKAVREDITRMSSKPMIKVQEDVTVLRQLLSVVANGLQRNACSVEKLKQEMAQKLKDAEMAQRTKDIPASMQYENTAPTEYFQHLVEEFEERMVTYRQQIETLDSHLAALHQPTPHTPSELLLLLKKLHETFISLAAQLQQVHEAVKAQKDQFLTYRRVFHSDSKNIFHKSMPLPKTVKKTHLSELAGPNPFPDTTNTAAQAMAMVHSRAQQPQGPPVTGLSGGTQTGFGMSSFSSGIFGTPKSTTGFGSGAGLSSVGPNIGGVGNLFSSTSLLTSPASGGFGTTPTLGSSTTAALNLAGTSLNTTNNAKQPFQLQKPPQGAKRGKR